MKALTYIFATIFTIATISNSFATDKGKDKNVVAPKATIELRTEILSLIEDDATLEAGRNLILDSLTFTSNFLTDLIEADAASEAGIALENYKPLELATLENLAEINANSTVDIKLNYVTINENDLQALIDNNVKVEIETIKRK